MSASKESTDQAGLVLIANLWDAIEGIKHRIDNDANGHLRITTQQGRDLKETMVFCAHRLAFLEMVTKGLSFMEQHDAQAYAKFMEKKRKIEDMDIEELRVLLR